MVDPVILFETGQTYERREIKNWFATGACSCPVTRQTITVFGLTPNHVVRSMTLETAQRLKSCPKYGQWATEFLQKKAEDDKALADEKQTQNEEAERDAAFEVLYAAIDGPDGDEHQGWPLLAAALERNRNEREEALNGFRLWHTVGQYPDLLHPSCLPTVVQYLTLEEIQQYNAAEAENDASQGVNADSRQRALELVNLAERRYEQELHNEARRLERERSPVRERAPVSEREPVRDRGHRRARFEPYRNYPLRRSSRS